ncbi:conserved Plasmodium protein, unknown function [Plasmodium gallinaceum]|uniref:CS domain-containing protein n=1 Tax=Plasmodium gallinaceum TaxID=5849 RepID=A0A1J1GQW0_PLAGA|nr:conserved Plasmodium protein, unknown function [Plasmodium gallinaceum]CRG94926.1 conserved Plasmodium protein, unknown function [Plasmodium gallinaceum]
MLHLLKKIYIIFSILFFFQWDVINSLNFHFKVREYNTKIVSDYFYLNKKLFNNYLFLKTFKKKKFLLKTKKIKSTNENEEDNLGIEIEDLIKNIEKGNYGEDSLKLYKEIENNSKLKEEEEKKIIEKYEKKMNIYNVDDVIKNTDDKLKKCVRSAFSSTSKSETEDPYIKKEHNIMNKIGETFDEIIDDDYPEEELNISNIYKKVNSTKDNNSDSPFKNAAKTLLKYKGLLRMPFEKCPLLNNSYFHWRESMNYIECYIPIFQGTVNKDILFYFKNDYIKLEILKGSDKILLLDHKLCGKINYADTYWVITNDYIVNEKHINLIMPKLGNYLYIWEKLLQD